MLIVDGDFDVLASRLAFCQSFMLWTATWLARAN